jgi:hypothetical protein
LSLWPRNAASASCRTLSFAASACSR